MRGFFFSVVLITGMAGVFVFPSLSASVDELFLTGIVKGIDQQTGIITVDVKSESCRGIRHFKLIDATSFKDILPGRKISFRINNATCKSDVVYKMILPRGTK